MKRLASVRRLATERRLESEVLDVQSLQCETMEASEQIETPVLLVPSEADGRDFIREGGAEVPNRTQIAEKLTLYARIDQPTFGESISLTAGSVTYSIGVEGQSLVFRRAGATVLSIDPDQ